MAMGMNLAGKKGWINNMINRVIKLLDGKKSRVVKLEIISYDEQFDLRITFLYENEFYCFRFENVRDLKLNANNPFIINCFEIIDTSNRGWERDRRYYVHDVDSDSISFYCHMVTYDI